MKLSATILAAGRSRRMGDSNKLLLPIDQKPMIYLVCKAAMEAKIDQLILVTGYKRSDIEKVVPKGMNNIIFNKNWSSGMMSSICVGLSKLDVDIVGNMIILGDMPLIKTTTLNRLVDEFKKNKGEKIIYPLYNKEQANPVIFPKKYFPEILHFQGDIGCKKIIKKYQKDTIGININSAEVIIDCDTFDDYFLIEKRLVNNVEK